MKFCPLCNIPKKSHIKRHILRTHLPWFWSPTTACWVCEEQSCHESSLMYHYSVSYAHNDSNTFDENNLHRWCQLMNGAFYLLLDWLRLESLHDLYQYLHSREIKAHGTFTSNEKRCMEFYAMNYSIHPQSQFSINPPSHLITVFHCEIITRLLQRYQTPNRLHRFTRTCQRLASTGSEIMPLYYSNL